MREELAPLAIDVSTAGYSTAQLALAALLFLLFAAGLTVATWRLQYRGLEGNQPAHKRALRESKRLRDPEVARFGRDEIEEDPARVASEVRDLFESAGGAEVETRGRVTVRGALGEIRSTVRETWRDATSSVPGVAIRLVERALLVAIFGAVAVSTSTVVRWLTKNPDYPTAADIVAETTEYGQKGSSILLETLGLYPGADLIWALAFTLAYRLGSWLFTHWYYVAGALVVIGLAIWVLEREVLDQPRQSLIWSRRKTSRRLVAILVPTWVAGATPVAVGRELGREPLGIIIGIPLSAFAFVVAVGLVLRRVSVSTLLTVGNREDPPGALLLDWGLRHVGAVLAAVSIPLVGLYILVGLADGSVAAVVEAFLGAERGVQALVGLVAVSIVALLAYMARGAVPAVREALVESLSRATVRSVLLVRGIPILGVILAYLLSFGFGLSFSLAIVAAVVVGLLSRLAIVGTLRVRATASLYGDWIKPDESALFIVVRAYELEDADGTPRYYAGVNSKAVAHDSVDKAVEAVLDLSSELVDEDESDPTLPEEYARDLLKYGLVGIERTEAKIEQRIREEVEGRLSRDNGLPRSEVERALEGRYPPDIWSSKLREWRLRGVIRERDGYLYRVR